MSENESNQRPISSESRGDRLQPSTTSRIHWHLTCLRKAFQEVIDRRIRNKECKRLIDFGCGNMPYRPLFETHVQRYDGADLGGNELATITIDSQGGMPIDDDSADIVLSSQVLEHVGDPDAYLRECHRVLKPTGLLMLSTHGVWRYHPDPTDFWRWTSAGLKRLIESHQFEIAEFVGIMGPLAMSLQILQDATLGKVPSLLRPLYCWPMQKAMRLADFLTPQHVTDSDACAYLVVARPIASTPR